MMVILNTLTIYHSPLLTIAPDVIKLSLPLEGAPHPSACGCHLPLKGKASVGSLRIYETLLLT